MELEFHQLDRRYEDLRLRRPERERSLLASLAEQGQQMPIVVVKEEGSYLVIDGFKRLRCLERLGSDTVRATLWDLEQSDALLLDRSQRSSEGLSQLEQGWLLAALRSQGLSQEKLAQRVDKSVSWVSRRLALVGELPTQVQEHVRRGAIPAHAAMRHLVPLARRNRQACLRLAEAIAVARLSSREVGELCSAFSQSSAKVRERLLEDPRLFLRARAQKDDPPPLPAQLEMLRDLDKMARTARRLCERLGDVDPSPEQLAELRLASAQVRSQLDTFDEETHRAGREDPQHHPDSRREEDLDARHRQTAEDFAQQRRGGDCLTEQSTEEDLPAGEGRALPRRDPGASRDLPRQSREGPRGADDPGRTDFLPGSDRLLSPSWDRDQAQAAGGQVPLRAGPGDAARHLPTPS
jgi:ParB/RepB/Spo0J family partition protein